MTQLGDPVDAAADLLGALDQVHGRHVALAQHHRALHARGPGAHDEHALVTVGRGMELLRMPPAAVLLPRGGVLGADHGGPTDLPARYALVAADALADVLESALLDLLGQERI